MPGSGVPPRCLARLRTPGRRIGSWIFLHPPQLGRDPRKAIAAPGIGFHTFLHLPPWAVILALLLCGMPLHGQLRPHEPLAWEIFDPGIRFTGGIGFSQLRNQQLTLLGSEGRLRETGAFQSFYRTGRIALEAAGTIHRTYRERARFEDPLPFVQPAPGPERGDVGDFRISTSIALTPPDRATLAVLRFGTRLPTTDNRVGLERDETDFFALVGGRADLGPARLAGEFGVGIHGTRDPDSEQSDVFVYLTSIGLPHGRLQPSVLLVGHADGRRGPPIRGNEELSEVRFRLRAGSRLWLAVEAIHGLTRFSPDTGLSAEVGASF